MISGCVWSLRNQPSITRDLLSSLVVNSVLLHTGTQITPQITIDFLVLDDNDADLVNGGPHSPQINAGFGAHNMPGPYALTFKYPSGRPQFVPHAGGIAFTVEVGAGFLLPQQGTGVLFYRTDPAGAYSSITLNQTSANVYQAVFPSLSCNTVVEYYVAATSTTSVTATEPQNAPASIHRAAIGEHAIVRFNDNFEADRGWSVLNEPNGAGPFTGGWQRATPTGGGVRNDPPTDADGSGMCYVTQNQPFNGDFDVDNGVTTLTSPTIDASAGPAIVSYWRWYNNSGAAQDDPFVVEISNNDGSTWAALETIGPTGPETAGGWIFKTFFLTGTTSQFRVRFIARDTGNISAVEAGLDGVRVAVVICCPADWDRNGSVQPGDISAFVNTWFNSLAQGTLEGDYDGNGFIEPSDISTFVGVWFNALNNGC